MALAGVAPGLELAGGMSGDRELPGTGRPPGMEGADGVERCCLVWKNARDDVCELGGKLRTVSASRRHGACVLGCVGDHRRCSD